MNLHHTIHIRTFNGHAVLPRILLGFSRRRIRILALQFFDVFDDGDAELQIDFDADRCDVIDLVKQLDRIIEVRSIRSESRDRVGGSRSAESAPVAA